MKMKWMAAKVGVSAFALLALLLGAMTANAQQIVRYRGRFTLPYQVRFGSTNLPPGEYTLTFATLSSSVELVTVRGEKKSAMVTVGKTVWCRSCNEHALIVVPQEEGRAIGALYLRGLRATFFVQKKGSKKYALARIPESAERIPLSKSGN